MSILCLAADAVKFRFIVLKVLTLNVAMLTMVLHLSKFGLTLGFGLNV